MNNLQNTGVNQKAAIRSTAYIATKSLENKNTEMNFINILKLRNAFDLIILLESNDHKYSYSPKNCLGWQGTYMERFRERESQQLQRAFHSLFLRLLVVPA